MARPKTSYVCGNCGARTAQWQGQCPACEAWNTLELAISSITSAGGSASRRGPGAATATGPATSRTITEIAQERDVRAATGIGELDRVLGGGLVAGSVVLLGGDPGIGKSTLLLQAADALSRERPVLYVSGEESVRQVASRAQRLGLDATTLRLAAETRVEAVIEEAVASRAQVLVVDSIQTMQTELSESSAGSAVQVRESAARLVRFGKESGTAVLLIGHVTKEGQIAGPRILEHMVDTVLYFESDPASRFRVVRAVKNRYGSANELGVFVMAEQGLREVKNPSAIFLSRHAQPVPGSVVTVVREGSRPLLVEVQALADDAQGMNPRRVAVGFESSRLALLLAVLHRHGGVATAGRDVFVNVVGGVRIGETSADLPAVLAVLSSVRDRPVAVDTVCFGELGLTGEIRPVPYGEERLREAAKQGFKRALVPAGNVPRRGPQVEGIAVEGVARLQDALDKAF
ncbi:MAG TPA: DNA repair protein RadA [Steroidobacteraceae bacterium]|nr:DNA repair protein RadA [Steroidobacteraceae bacterium]